MKHKSPFVSRSLMREAFSQLKLIGIMYLMIVLAWSILLPLFINTNDTMSMYQVSALMLSGIVIPGYYFGLPIMVLYTFRFLSDRVGSDFYHGLPVSRGCLYRSFLAAVFAWYLLLIAVNVGVGSLTVALLRHTTLNLHGAAVVYASFLAAGLFMIAVTVLAVSLTGTILTNLSVAVMLALIPRTVLFVMYHLIIIGVPFLTIRFDDLPLISGSLNIPFSVIPVFFSDYSVGALFHRWSSVFYTAGVGLIYLIAAQALFIRRNSELAGQTGLNSVLRMIFRLMPAFFVCLIPLILLIEGESGNTWIIIWYVLAVLVYLFYELITTKRTSRVWKSLPGLLILLILNLAFLGAVHAGQSFLLNRSPEDIRSVSYSGSDYYYSIRSVYEDCLRREAASYQITDPECIDILSNGFRRSQEWARGDYYDKMNDDSIKVVRAEFHCGSGIFASDFVRDLKLTQEEISRIDEILETDEAYLACFRNFPESSSVISATDTASAISAVNTAGPVPDHEQSVALYELFLSYVGEVDDVTWAYAVSHESAYSSSLIFTVQTAHGTESLCVPLDVMPLEFRSKRLKVLAGHP